MNLEEYKNLRDQGLTPEQIKAQQGRKGLIGFGIGAAKGLGSTVRTLGVTGQEILQQTAGRAVEAITGIPKEKMGAGIYEGEKPEFLKPKGGVEKAGYYAEQIAEFLAPSGMIAKGQKALMGTVKGAGKLAGLGRLGIKAGTEALATGGIASIQAGEIDESAKIGAIFGAMFPVAGKTLRGFRQITGKGIQETGEKIARSIIRPTITDLKDVGLKMGTKKETKSAISKFMDNVFKHDLGGSLSETFIKANAKINNLTRQLAKKIKVKGEMQVDLKRIAEETQQQLVEKKAGAFGALGSTERAMSDLAEEIMKVSDNTGMVNLIDAQLIKKGAGAKGAWAYGMMDREAKAIEKVYTKFYGNLKREIERIAPAGIKEINRQISEIIPILNATIRRMPVAERNNALSLTDIMGLYAAAFDPKALAIFGANKLSKSGKFANILYKAGKALKEKTTSRTGIGRRFFD